MSPEFSFENRPVQKNIAVSAYTEMLRVAPERLIRDIHELQDKVVWLSDGSTSISNCRSIELVTTLIAAQNLNGIASEIVTDVVGGGYALWAMEDLGLKRENLTIDKTVVSKLKDVFPKAIFDERTAPFMPAEAFILPVTGHTLREANLRARESLLNGACNYIGIQTPQLHVIGFEEIPQLLDVTVGDILDANRDSTSQVLKFTCPDCSRQQSEACAHGILADGKVVKERGGDAKCHVGRDVTNQIREGELKNRSMVELMHLGFYVSGKAAYQLLSHVLDSERDALLVRNYSNSRGTGQQIIQNIPGQIGITNRFYFEDKKEIPGKLLMSTLKESPALVQAIRQTPLLAQVDQDIFLPC